MSDVQFVTATPDAVALIEAVQASDEAAARDVLARQSESTMWALAVALAAMAPAKPSPERVLRFACSVETRLTYSQRPESWHPEDLADAVMVYRSRTAVGAAWVARGVREWRRRRAARTAYLDGVNEAAMRLREAS